MCSTFRISGDPPTQLGETKDCARQTGGSLLHIRFDYTESDKIGWHLTTHLFESASPSDRMIQPYSTTRA